MFRNLPTAHDSEAWNKVQISSPVEMNQVYIRQKLTNATNKIYIFFEAICSF